MRLQHEVSSSIEEYLESIYRLQDRDGVARTKELAMMMKVGLGTVTNTVAMLERRGYIQHEPYRGVTLTDGGRKIALDVIRRHRLAERLVTDILHMDWDKAHEAACKLEHGLDSSVIRPLEKALGHPRTCPHGNPLPTKCGSLRQDESVPLAEFKPGQVGIVSKIVDETQELLQYLSSIGLAPGTRIEVKQAPQPGELIIVEVAGSEMSLGRHAAACVHVVKLTGRRSNVE